MAGRRIYDPSKDVAIVPPTTIYRAENDSARIDISVYSYDGNTPKIQLQRVLITQRGEIAVKLGRLLIEEMDAVVAAYTEWKRAQEKPAKGRVLKQWKVKGA